MDPEIERQATERLKATLLTALEEFFSAYAEDEARDARKTIDAERLRAATTALLLQMARADFDCRPEEQAAIAHALQRTLGLGPEDAVALLRLATGAEAEFRFPELVHLIDAQASHAQKQQIVEALWRVAFADAEILAHEEYLVRKICDLLHLSTADLIEAKVRAREAFE